MSEEQFPKAYKDALTMLKFYLAEISSGNKCIANYLEVMKVIVEFEAALSAKSVPKDAKDIRNFIGDNFDSLSYGMMGSVEPSDDDLYTVSAHDLLSSFSDWQYTAPQVPTDDERVRELVASLNDMLSLYEMMMKQCDLGNSALQSDCLMAMNQAPIRACKAIASMSSGEQG